MKMEPENLNLNAIKERVVENKNETKSNRPPAKVRSFRASDLMTADEKRERELKRFHVKKKRKFNDVDAFIAETIARFGYDTYKAWKSGELKTDMLNKLLLAERARSAQERYLIEGVIIASVAGANNPTKHGRTPKGLKQAVKMLERDEKMARLGEM